MKLNNHSLLIILLSTLTLCLPASLEAAIAIDEGAPWPRVRSTNGNTVTLHLPQVERWTSDWFSARAAVEVKPAKENAEFFGVIWFEARGSVDKSNRLVTLDRLEITKCRFPEAPDNESNIVAIIREVLPSGARTVSLDYLIATLGFEKAAARQGPAGLKHVPPEILWVTNRTVLVIIDGQPLLKPVPGGTLERVVNTPALLVRDASASRFYLSGNDRWFSAASLEGPWALAQQPPPAVAALAPAPTASSSGQEQTPPPKIVVSTSPAELLSTGGLPDFRPIKGTSLQYAADSDSQLFFDTKNREAYLLISGRWFKASSLKGPWTYVSPRDLPDDFAKIPTTSPQGIVLASVPDTPQAELALLANSLPTVATIKRAEAKLEVSYDGEPRFEPVEGTELTYAVNAQPPVIRSGNSFYAVQDGVWFVAESAKGPWQVATEVPEEIYSIPPKSPLYYTTFARVYQASDDEVEVGYTPGYVGAYENDGTMVYGTGWQYQPWYGNDYYGWGWTWGYSYLYVPWYQWWVWRPWWNDYGGLRAALIDNLYDRWHDKPHVAHRNGPYDGIGSGVPGYPRYSGHPALYGRVKNSAAMPLSLPPNTLALNPYSRPESATRPGDVPRGAALLSSVRQAPGGGRDLYASPDGNVYSRRNDGWYRRDAGDKWAFFAPLQGRIDGDRLASAAGTRSAGGNAYRPAPGSGARGPSRRDLLPNSGAQVRAQQVAALERQYYARTMAQMRSQSWRGGQNISRPSRGAVRRR
jgi:hypothetical protein